MLQITEKQNALFEEASLRRFKESLFHHLQSYLPAQAAFAGPEKMRLIIDLGLERAARYGFIQRGPTRFYLELMLMLGSYFDEDPQYKWAQEILSQEKIDPMSRAESLHKKFIVYQADVFGESDSFEKEAFKAFLNMDTKLIFINTMPHDRQLVELLRNCYPQKFSHIGITAVKALVIKARQHCQEHQLPPDSGRVLLTFLMYFFGYGVMEDIQFTALTDTLKAEPRSEPLQCLENLLTNTKSYLTKIISGKSNVSLR